MERTWSCFDCQFEDAEPLCFTEEGAFDPTRLAHILFKIANTDGSFAERGEPLRAFDCIDEMVQSAPEAAVIFILTALDECRTGEHVALLGAGALETLLKMHGPKVIGQFEHAAQKHAKVRYLLSATWGQESIIPAIWQRLISVVSMGPVMDADGRSPAAGMADKVISSDDAAKLLATPMQ